MNGCYGKLKFYIILLSIMCVFIISGCGRKYTPTSRVLELQKEIDKTQAVELINKNLFAPKGGTWSGSDKQTSVTATSDGLIFKNLFQVGKYLGVENGMKIYEKERFDRTMKFSEIDKFHNLGGSKFNSEYCNPPLSVFMVSHKNIGSFLYVCVDNQDEFYAGVMILAPQVRQLVD